MVEDEHAEEPIFGPFEAVVKFMPDKVTIYRLPLEADFPDPVELQQEIRMTVLTSSGTTSG